MKASSLILSGGTLAFLGAVAVATSMPTAKFGNPNNPDGPKSKKVKFKHDSDLDTYLTSIRSFMLVPPRDGLFGASRVPTMHGQSRSQVPGYEAVKALRGEKYDFMSFVVGNLPQQTVEAYGKAVKNGNIKAEEVPKYRVTMVHRLFNEDQSRYPINAKLRKDLYDKAQSVLAKTRAEGLDEFSESFTTSGRAAWLMTKSVKASDKSCYKCHTDIKEGEAIGYVTAVMVKDGP